MDLNLDQEDGQLNDVASEALKQGAPVLDKAQRLNHGAGENGPVPSAIHLGRQIGDSAPRGGTP